MTRAAAPVAAFLILLTSACALHPAFARWKPEYAAADPAVRSWYETRELTPAAQKRFGFRSCCAHADVVHTQFKVAGDGHDQWLWQTEDGTFKPVPGDIIHWNEFSPGQEPVMFAVGGQPVCFFPPGGGI